MNSPRSNGFAPIDRRRFRAAAAVAAAFAAAAPSTDLSAADDKPARPALKGRIKQAITPGVLRKMSCRADVPGVRAARAARASTSSARSDWPTLKKHGLICTMAQPQPAKGLNRKENHEQAVAALRKAIEAAAEAGFPNVICMSGNRAGLSDEEGAANCVEGLKQIAAFAEEKKVTSAWNCSTRSGTTRTTSATARPGASRSARRSAARGSSCSTTSTTCRCRRAT